MTEGAKDQPTIPEQLETLKKRREELSMEARDSVADTKTWMGGNRTNRGGRSRNRKT